MRCTLPAVLTLGVMLSSAATAKAQWGGGFQGGGDCQCGQGDCHMAGSHHWGEDLVETMKRDFHRNNSWPLPFIYADREAVNVTLSMVANNGWRKQMLMSDYHFQEDGAKLTAAGELKLRWMLTQTPVQRRIIFVQRGAVPEITAARLESVQQSAMRQQPKGQIPEVIETDLTNEGTPAEEVDDVMKALQKSRPAPRLSTSQDQSKTGT